MDNVFIKRRFNNNRGSVLMWAVVMSLCTILIGTAYLLLANSFAKLFEWDHGRVENIYAMSSGLKIAQLRYIGTSPTSSPGTSWDNYYGGSEYGYGIDQNGGGSEGLANWSNYIIWGIGRTSCDNGNMVWRDSVSYGYGVQSFADYLWLTNDEHEITTGDSILWWTPDTLDGRVHSNGYLFIHGTQNRPLFLKKVTTCKPDTKPPRAAYPAAYVYKGGFQGNVGRIVFPNQADSVRRYSYGDWLIGRADSARFMIYYIRFFNGSSFKVLSKRRGTGFPDTSMTSPGVGWNSVPFRGIPPLGAIFVYGKLFIDAPRFVSGRSYLAGIDGRLTIASSDSMIVLHNTYYACSNAAGRVPLGCNDALGLISERFLLMSKQCGAPLYPNPGALIVNAGLVALSGSMGCESVSSAPEFNSLMIHGSIAQLNRGVVHRGPAGSGTGFVQKDYFYDQRFSKSPPPHFVPTGDLNEYYIE